MTKVYAITRHAGALDFIRRSHPQAEAHVELTDAMIATMGPGDIVIGPLPVKEVAKLTARGVRYEAIDMETPSDRRGQELTAEDMVSFGARRRAYAVTPVYRPPADAVSARPRKKQAGPIWRGLMRLPLLLAATVLAAIALKLAGQLVDGLKGILAKLASDPSALIESLRRVAAGDFDGSEALLAAVDIGGSLLVMIVAYGAIWWSKSRIIHASFAEIEFEPRKILVQGLSTPSIGQRRTQPELDAVIEGFAALPITIVGLSQTDLQRELERLREAAAEGDAEAAELLPKVETFAAGPGAERFNWQQSLRAILANLSDLKRVYVLPSSNGRPCSADSAEIFAEMARSCLHHAGHMHVDVVVAAPSGIDYENHDACREALTRVQRRARSDTGVKPSDITIDCTSGQKIFSVAAAFVTVNTKANLIYVDHEGIIRAFDGKMSLIDRVE